MWEQSPAQAVVGCPPCPLFCLQRPAKSCRDQQCWVTPKSRCKPILRYRRETLEKPFSSPHCELFLDPAPPSPRPRAKRRSWNKVPAGRKPGSTRAALFFSPSSFAFMNLFHKLPLLTASHLCQALAHLILPLAVFLSSGQGYFLAASSAKMPIC